MDTIGSRIKKIREIRGYSQKDVANKIGVHVTLLQQYERGIKKPKEIQLQKIAEALLVDVDMLRLPKADSGDAILSYLYELMEHFDSVSIEETDGSFNIRIPSSVCDFKMKEHLRNAATAQKMYSPDEFKLWLLNYRYYRIKTMDMAAGKSLSRYPELEVIHKSGNEQK